MRVQVGLQMALFRSLFLLLFATAFCCITTGSHYSESQFLDPKIECDVAKLALDYAKKLQPFRESFNSIYDALELQKCNVTIGPSLKAK